MQSIPFGLRSRVDDTMLSLLFHSTPDRTTLQCQRPTAIGSGCWKYDTARRRNGLMNQLFHVVHSSNKSRCRVWFLRSVTSSLTSGDERWIRTVLKDLHPVLTQRVSERAEWTPLTTEETSTASTRQNLRLDMSYERLMELGIFSIVGDHEGHKQRLPTTIPFSCCSACDETAPCHEL